VSVIKERKGPKRHHWKDHGDGENILEVIEEKRLPWFGHVKRMPGNRLPVKILEWEPEETRRRGRPKERWIDGVRRSITNHGLTEEDTRDRDRW
jgi:hypothetical protein